MKVIYFHYPNITFTQLQAESMKIPQLIEKITSVHPENESEKLNSLIVRAKENFSIEGIVHGGILSKVSKR